MSDNWDVNDPFGGDINFDDDFDHDAKGSKLKSFAIGFLGGAKEALIGSTDAKLRTVKMGLPESFNGTFQFINDTRRQYNELKDEFKRNTAESMKDIQYLMRNKTEGLKNNLPGGLGDKVDQFSKYDFSQWADTTTSSDSNGMENTSEDDVKDIITTTQQSSLLTLNGLKQLGKDVTDAVIASGASQSAGNTAIAMGINKSNLYLKQLVDYQIKVQQRNDAMKINLLARMHITNAKYYKFMEIAQHRMVKEIKDVVKYSKMPDFQKMSYSDEVRKRIRGSFFNTARSGLGGIMGLVNDKVGKYARDNGYSALNNLTSQLSMASSMTDGLSSRDMIEMLGSLVGSGAIDALPRLLRGQGSQALQARLARMNPRLAARIRQRYRKADSFGNQLSYGLNNMEGLFNTLSANYQGGNFFDEDEQMTYEEYKATLPAGQKPLSKTAWNAQQWAKRTANKGLGVVLDNTYGSGRTRYDLKGRSYADGIEQHIWTRQSDRTLNEIIPALLSQIHLSQEKMRTGNNNLQPITYDWTKGKFVSAAGAKATALREVYGSSVLGSAVYSAGNAADTIDKNNSLSKTSKQELAYQLARQSDSKMGFSPYNLLNLEKEGVDPKIAEEIRQMTLANFGITADNHSLFNTGSDADRFKLLTGLTGKGAALANQALPLVQDIKRGIYDTNENIDKLRNSGYYDALRNAGIIKTVNGKEEVDDAKMWKMFRLQQTDPNFDKKLRQQLENDNINNGDTINRIGNTTTNNVTNNFGELNDTLAELNQNIKGSGLGNNTGNNLSPNLSQLNTQMDTLIGIQTNQSELLQKILEKQPTIIRRSKGEQKQEEEGKKTLLDRIKGISPRNLFNKGVETLLNNEPLILGGLVGGLGALALHDPRTAGLLAAGGLAVAGYNKLRSMNETRFAETGDLYENEGDEEPLLRGSKLKSGDYYDSATRKVLQTWSDVTSAIVDKAGNIVASVQQLSKKLFGPDGRAVMLKGFNKAKELGLKLFNAIDPIGRMRKALDKVSTRFYQMDVYRQGEKSPVLLGSKMGKGWYFKLDSSDKPVEIMGWNEIDGPVYDKNGECIITQDDFDRGLQTSMGVSINKLGSMSKSAGLMGIDLLSKFKDKAINAGSTAYNKSKEFVKADYTPITNSIDRIYYLLCNKFGIKPTAITDDEKMDTIVTAQQTGTMGDPGDTRLNSLADEKQKAKEKKQDKVNDAIINIGDSLGGINKGGEKKEKKKGLLGLLLGGVGMVKGLAEAFFGKTLVNGFGTLFKFASMGLTSLPKIASGIGMLAKFFMGRKIADSAGDLLGDGLDAADSAGGRDTRSRRERARERLRARRGRTKLGRLSNGVRNFGGKFLKAGGGSFNPKTALLKAGALYLGGQAASELMDNDTISTVSNALTGYSLASSALGAVGVDIGVGALASGAGTLIGGAASGLGALGTAAGAALMSPIGLGVLAVGGIALAGYGVYKWYTKGKYRQVDIRYAQYGINDIDSNLGKKVAAIEQLLTKHVVIQNGNASFSTDTPIQSIFEALQTGEDGAPIAQVGDVFSWFNGRFKPVFLTYMSCLDTMKLKSLEEYDKLTDKMAYDIAYQATQAIGNVKPFPYAVTPPIDPKEKLMGTDETRALVGQYLEELKKYLAKSDDTAKVKDVTMKHLDTQESLQKEKEGLDKKLEKTSFFGFNGTTSFLEKRSAENRLKEIDDEMAKLNDAYGPGKVAGTVDVRDLIPDNGIMNPFVLVRFNAYGINLSANNGIKEWFPPWKFEAIARLERRVEKLIKVIGTDARFFGKTGELFQEFKAAFRVKDDKANDWCLWFRDRFLPVMMVYMRQYNQYGQGLPKDGWQTITDTARYQIALAIIDTRISKGKGKLVPVWNIRTTPFSDGFSVPKTDEVDKLINALQELSNKAKLSNPVLEAQRTSSRQGLDQTLTHAVGGGATDKFAYQGDQTRQDVALDAGYNLPEQQYNSVAGNSDINQVDLSGVTSNGGNDTGVSVPRSAAEQLIIKEMMAEGITDPRAIAEMLALTNYESTGYKNTVENMRYTDPGRLMSLFKEVTNMTTAQQLVRAGPQAIANHVYGGSKGASLGNTDPGDGWKYRGRGFVQLTGKANYKKYGDLIGVDLVKNPELASTDPKVMAKIAVAFYKNSKQLQSITSPNSNFGYAAKGLNGGNALPGMDKRFALYKDYLDALQTGKLKPEGDPKDTPKTATSTPVLNNTTPSPQRNPDENTGVNGIGTMPSMSQFGLGGGGEGVSGGYQKIADATAVASGTRSIDYKGLKVKSEETTAGGPVHPGIIRVCQEIQSRVSDFVRFTALNDAYHQKNSPRSKHTAGLALDFTVQGEIRSSDAAVSVVKTIMSNAGMTPAEYLVLNEYRNPSGKATGGHIHFNFASDSAADKYLKMAGNSAPGTADNAAPDAAQGAEAGTMDTGTTPAPDTSNVPNATPAPSTGPNVPLTRPNVTPDAMPASPTSSTPPNPTAGTLDPKMMAAAVKAGGDEQTQLLRQIAELLKAQQKPEAVKLN